MPVRTAALAALILPAAVAQAPAVDAPTQMPPCVAVGVLYAHADGPTPLAADVAQVLAAVRLAAARNAAPAVAASLHVDADCACIVGAAPRADADALAAFVAALATLPGSDDELARAAAAAALALDDARHLLPGGAFAAAVAGLAPVARPPLGPEALLQLSPATLRQLAGERPPRAVGESGQLPTAVRAALPAARGGVGLPAPAAAAAVAPPSTAIVDEVHRRIDQPFVAVAFAVPADLDRAALAAGLAVARERAAVRLPLRGTELRAGTPLVDWSWLHGDRVVRCHRRGASPVRMRPGEPFVDAAAERDATAAELRQLLAELQRPVEERELAPARRQLAAELGGQLRADAADPAAAALCLRQALLRNARGIDLAAVAAVTPEQATAALQRLTSAPSCWRALLPTPSAALGWRPR